MIVAPVTYCAEDQKLVAAFETLPSHAQLGSYWSDPVLVGLKSRVKTFYIVAQNVRCCYCNRHLGSYNHQVWQVDHVASRHKHARFMFTPVNLVASCPDCNVKKGKKETLKTPNGRPTLRPQQHSESFTHISTPSRITSTKLAWCTCRRPKRGKKLFTCAT
jgi:hypothetical protein